MPLYELILLCNVTKKIQKEHCCNNVNGYRYIVVYRSIIRTDRIEVFDTIDTSRDTFRFRISLKITSSRYFCTRTENVTRNGSYECKHRQVFVS